MPYAGNYKLLKQKYFKMNMKNTKNSSLYIENFVFYENCVSVHLPK